MKQLIIGLIKLYRYSIGLLIPPSCRFYPTCSNYMHEALVKHGLIKGLWLGMKRILRCHPWNQGGYDPVP
ncbi:MULTISPECIES: membrane protein insertion efficiency factor YidD [Nitrosomonas]|uniref:membrane protein insertion efficiency factor YidD n=1 Tax=Nitrosomonas TaxID=914 RepID=UPI00079ACD04|nr:MULTISPECIES: membrane protein insertion efficiency factor YidD [Nitrosomonas]KXK50597.1 MAG: putative membrane protein insertion efficiency factor [Nitrosomonas europaea]MEB2331126.1 membrane protein insertion efficiency factor YidD [Nitrosomonas sp.]QOJ09509.1 MAG: membrane protein insertion efficiency factor YidD [Nitrosomonas sp. H1_AOB3]HNR10415.1 membrane protein insertion efficiency factor YidD [Nitrosomonas europaea]HNS59265.1 membrane protein insertion efficiency factor YidD [Nitro